MQIRRNALVLIGVLLLGSAFLVVSRPRWSPLLLGRFLFTCRDEVNQEMPSRGGEYVARVYERDCGATTRFSTYLELRAPRPWLFGAKTQEVFVQENRCTIGLTWTGDTLQVAYPQSCGKVFRRIDSWSGIHVKFKTNPPW